MSSAGSARFSYGLPGAGFDEAFGPDGQPRPHWQPFFRSMETLEAPEVVERWQDARHLIRDNGVTYNVYGDPRGSARPWHLDPFPLLIAPPEADLLERGLKQRGLLLERILADLYGPQRLLRTGLIPSELIYGNPGFLRPCHGVKLPGNRRLHLYAANLGRHSDGTWRVLGDRTQAPSGAGYVLENRIVMTRTWPESFKDCRVQRLSLFFRALRDGLRAVAPGHRENPRVVLLTPGPLNETYFEHAYLARYLGYTLAEGGDLTVRDKRVYLKMLGGLQPVDVIFRRLDDDFCDPLELRADSFLGVPGLVGAVRAGNVAVANALGSGVLETPALMAFLPALCRDLLDDDLALPSVPTWWCGDPAALDHVIARLGDMVVKPAFPAARMEPIFPDDLDRAARAELVARIRARPREFVGEERLDLSTAPLMVGDRLEPRKMVLRTYLAADGDSFAVMPGGLTRISSNRDTMVVSMQRGGGSKDTWVLASGAVSDFSLLPGAGSRVELTRAGGDLPSRAADNLFWLGRYAERAEGKTRLLRAALERLTERSGLAEVPELPALLRALAHGSADRAAKGTPPPAPGEPVPVVLHATFGPHAGSLAKTVVGLRELAGTVRDLISIDMWRVLNGLSDFPVGTGTVGSPLLSPTDVLDLLNRTVIALAAFGGLAVESMTRGVGWRFLDMGRKLERAVHLTALLRNTTVAPIGPEAPTLDAVLEVADSGMTYRRRYLGSLRPEAVLDLLVSDETNPRSLAVALAALADDVNNLPQAGPRAGRTPAERHALTALNAVRLAEPEDLAVAADGHRPALKSLLERLAGELPALSDAIAHQYLSHMLASRHLSAQGGPALPGAEIRDRL